MSKRAVFLLPTSFLLHLKAMLEAAFKDVHEVIYIQTRLGADHFNVTQFKSKTRTTKQLVRAAVCR